MNAQGKSVGDQVRLAVSIQWMSLQKMYVLFGRRLYDWVEIGQKKYDPVYGAISVHMHAGYLTIDTNDHTAVKAILSLATQPSSLSIRNLNSIAHDVQEQVDALELKINQYYIDVLTPKMAEGKDLGTSIDETQAYLKSRFGLEDAIQLDEFKELKADFEKFYILQAKFDAESKDFGDETNRLRDEISKAEAQLIALDDQREELQRKIDKFKIELSEEYKRSCLTTTF